MRYFLNFRTKKVWGDVRDEPLWRDMAGGGWKDLNLAKFLRETAGRDVVFVMHGFNVNQENGLKAADRLSTHLTPQPQDPVYFGVVWPGDFIVPAINYPFAHDEADRAGAALAKFALDHVAPDARIFIVAHSLGCRVAMQMISKLKDGGRQVVKACLMAAAIDDHSLTGVYADAVAGAGRVHVLRSYKDRVLKWAYPAGDLFQSFVFFRREVFGLALGRHGPKDPPPRGADRAPLDRTEATLIDNDFKARHADYMPGETPSDAGAKANVEAAAHYVGAALAGADKPPYPR